jgi:biotin operon repressor
MNVLFGLEIGEDLGISAKTVGHHVQHVRQANQKEER